jgi:Zn-dependent protease with chaperone function
VGGCLESASKSDKNYTGAGIVSSREVRWIIEDLGNFSRMRITVASTKIEKGLLVTLSICSTLLLISSPSFLSLEYLSDPLQQKSLILFGGLFSTLFLVLALARVGKKIQRTEARITSRILEELGNVAIPIAGLSPPALSAWKDMALVYPPFLALVVLIWNLKLIWLTFLITLLGFRFLIFDIVSAALRDDPLVQWKMSGVEAVNNWTRICLDYVTLCVVLYYINVMATYSAFRLDMSSAESKRGMIEALQEEIDGQSIVVFSSSERNLQLEIFERIAEKQALQLKGIDEPERQRMKTLTFIFLIKWVSYVIISFVYICVLFLMLDFFRMIERLRKFFFYRFSPQVVVGHISVVTSRRRRVVSSLAILVHYAYAVLMNFLFIYLLYHSFRYFFYSQGVLLQEGFRYELAAILGSWISSSLATVTGPYFALRNILTYSLFFSLVIIAIPVLMSAGGSFFQIAYSAMQALTLRKRYKHRLTPRVAEWLSDASMRMGIRNPKVIVKESNRVDLYTRIGWPWTDTNEIILTRRTLEFFSVRELKAGLAHELGHIAQNKFLMRLSRLLSRLMLFANGYLGLCFDLARVEINADRFALEIFNDREALKSAVKKITSISTAEIVISRVNSRFPLLWTFVEGMVLLASFSVGERFLVPQYPFLALRLGLLDHEIAEFND